MIVKPEDSEAEVDIFVASRIGSFKHIKYHTKENKNNKKCIENLVDIKTLKKEDCITCLQWGNEEQTEILIGRKNQQVQVYSTTLGITATYTADFAPGHIVGLGRSRRKLLAATSSGAVRIWSKKVDQIVQTGGKLDVMTVSDEDSTVFATGGEENDLKIWRIGTAEPTFSAKNLANDWLQLRRSIWVSGVAMLPGGLTAVCSRHGYVRLYDTKAQRRPVINMQFPDGMAATCIVPSFDERQVLVGFGRGQLHQVDLRMGKQDKGYKGAGGAVTDIAICRRNGLVVSTSLDRHLRVHDHSSKDLLYKQYLTSKLSSVLVQSESSTPLRNAPEDIKEEEVKEEEGETDVGDELDALFDGMETVAEKPKKKQLSVDEEPPPKKVKPSKAGSTEVSQRSVGELLPCAVGTDEEIEQLLRSTEKLRKKREKKKRQKKAKSVFHNA